MAVTDTQLKTFLDTFTHTEAGDVKRNKFVLYVKKGTDLESSAWEAVGYKQESAAISNNYDTSDITDILGKKYSDKKDKNETIDLSEYHLNKDKAKFLDDAVKYTVAGLETELNDYSLLMVFGWLVDSTGKMLARKVDDCTLTSDNIGGQTFTMSDVSFSAISRGVFGTVDNISNPTFTEYTGE